MLQNAPLAPTEQILVALEDCIERYVAERRSRVSPFVDRHFSLERTIALQKRSLLSDLVCYPINMMWAIPYMFIKKTTESLGRLGWTRAHGLLSIVPSGMKRRYQKELETSIRNEFLEWPSDWHSGAEYRHALLRILKGEERVAPLLASAEFASRLNIAVADINRLIESYGANRSLASDLAGSFVTLATGWLMFGDHALGIEGIGERLASTRAKDQAAASFFLGSGLGSMFYSVFPPKPSLWEIGVATAAVGLLLTICGMIIGVFADPILKRLSLHHRQLHALLDDIEDRLHRLRRQVKPAIKQIAA